MTARRTSLASERTDSKSRAIISAMRIRDRFVDAPSSIGADMRARRWQTLIGRFPGIDGFRVLDLGGTTEYWERAPVRPAHVTVVNLLEPGAGSPWITPVEGDACDATTIPPGSYDLVVSNSLLEHLGGHAPRARLAQTIREVAPCYSVNHTPYRYFPLEPHWLFPGMQFAPDLIRAKIARHWPLSHSGAGTDAEALGSGSVGRSDKPDRDVHLSPDGDVFFERIMGVPKSLIAVRAAAVRCCSETMPGNLKAFPDMLVGSDPASEPTGTGRAASEVAGAPRERRATCSSPSRQQLLGLLRARRPHMRATLSGWA